MVSSRVSKITFVSECRRQFIETYDSPRTYSEEVKQHCLNLYVNGLGFRAIERVTDVHHTTVIHWVKQLGTQLDDAPEAPEIPQVGELDELETFVGSKNTKFGCGRRLTTSTPVS